MRKTYLLTLLTLSAFCGLAQYHRPMQHPVRPTSPASFGHYDYKVVFDNTKPIGGKQALRILALDIDDSGNVALIATCTDRLMGLWTSKQGWVTWKDKIITPRGRPMYAGLPEHLMLTPGGTLKYEQSFSNSMLAPTESHRGYFQDANYLFDVQPVEALGAHIAYGVDGRLLYAYYRRPDRKEAETVLSIDTSNPGKPPVDLLPASLTLDRIDPLVTSHNGNPYAFVGFTGNFTHTDLYVNGTVTPYYRAIKPTPLIPFPNSKGDVAFGTEDHLKVYVNGQPTRFIGDLLGFNDASDILLQDNRTVLVNENAVIEVVESGGRGRYPKFPHGVPEMTGLGAPYNFEHSAMNGKRQVAFAMQFLPVGQQPKYPNSGPLIINGLSDPWWVVVATPK